MVADYFWARVKRGEDGECWEWTAHRNKSGYGLMCHTRPMLKAHRYSWELHFGAIPAGMFVLHHCDNRACVNPVHLWLGNHADNMRDMREKGRSGKPWLLGKSLSAATKIKMSEKLRGHRGAHKGEKIPYRARLKMRGTGNPNARLTEEKVREIKQLLASGIPQKEIGQRVGISQPVVSAINLGKIWNHVK